MCGRGEKERDERDFHFFSLHFLKKENKNFSFSRSVSPGLYYLFLFLPLPLLCAKRERKKKGRKKGEGGGRTKGGENVIAIDFAESSKKVILLLLHVPHLPFSLDGDFDVTGEILSYTCSAFTYVCPSSQIPTKKTCYFDCYARLIFPSHRSIDKRESYFLSASP